MTPEYEHEPVKGLPGHLPEGERILWQGAPEWWPLARNVLRVRGVAIYFGLIAAWAGFVVTRESGLARGLVAAAWVLPVAFAALGILCALAMAMARTTVYTLTDNRLVLRYGVALPMAVNVPFSKVQGVSMRTDADGTGNIAFDIGTKPNIGYLMMWPHARPRYFSHTQPMLRGIRDPQRIADLMSGPLKRSLEAGQEIAKASVRPVDVLSPVGRPGSAGPMIGQHAAVAQAQS
jgi:Bacterial PH domain